MQTIANDRKKMSPHLDNDSSDAHADAQETDSDSLPPPATNKHRTVLIWFTFCLALVLLVAFNMR